jgi:hypothetical protein
LAFDFNPILLQLVEPALYPVKTHFNSPDLDVRMNARDPHGDQQRQLDDEVDLVSFGLEQETLRSAEALQF